MEACSMKYSGPRILQGLIWTELLVRSRKANNSMFSASLPELSYKMTQGGRNTYFWVPVLKFNGFLPLWRNRRCSSRGRKVIQGPRRRSQELVEGQPDRGRGKRQGGNMRGRDWTAIESWFGLWLVLKPLESPYALVLSSVKWGE